MSRQDAATAIARRVTERVARVAPRGLGRWPLAWERVEDPSTAFLDALHAWEAAVDPGQEREEALRDAVRETADTLVRAWAEAARRWEAAGRPGQVESVTTSEPVEAGR